MSKKLPEKEKQALQAVTIVMVIALVYILFILRRPMYAAIIGVVFLGLQKVYLHYRGKA